MYAYSAYGLNIYSCLEFPELPPTRLMADVHILLDNEIYSSRQSVPETYTIRADRDEVSLFWPLVGEFVVRSGREVIVRPLSKADERTLRFYILGPVIATVLHQRGYLVLHASAVQTNGGAIAFLGSAGCGKSTLAAALHDRGYSIISDDVVAVDLEGINATVPPGFPQLKLWPESILALGRLPEQMPKLRSSIEKRAFRVVQSFTTDPLQLKHIYALRESTTARVHSLGSQAAFIELVRHSYMAKVLEATNSISLHFHQCARLVKSVPVYYLDRSSLIDDLPRLIKSIEEHINNE